MHVALGALFVFVGGWFFLFVFETLLIEHCQLSAARDVAKILFVCLCVVFFFSLK